MNRIVAFFLRLINWLLSFIPGTTAHAYKKARAAYEARLALLAAQSQKQYPGAVALRLSGEGTLRNPRRSIRRVFAQMWTRAFPGWPLSGRQWVRANKAQRNGGTVRGRAAHVNYFLNGGDVKPPRAA